MKLKNLVLGTSALAGVAMLGLRRAVPAAAAEVTPGGALDLTLTGFLRARGVRWRAGRSAARQHASRAASTSATTPRSTSSPAARTSRAGSNTVRRSSSRPTPTRPLNTDETWIFLRGGWGELRMGDEDGVVDNSVIGGADDRGRHGRYRRLGRGDHGGAGRLPHQHQRRDQDPLLHAELRRLQRSACRYTPTQQTIDSGANNGNFFARKNGACRDGGRERRRRRPRSTTASSAASACWPRWSASTAS